MKSIILALTLLSSNAAFASTKDIKPTGEAYTLQNGTFGNGGTGDTEVAVYVDKQRGVVCYVTTFNLQNIRDNKISIVTASTPSISCVKL